jgi:hypothetical protein
MKGEVCLLNKRAKRVQEKIKTKYIEEIHEKDSYVLSYYFPDAFSNIRRTEAQSLWPDNKLETCF